MNLFTKQTQETNLRFYQRGRGERGKNQGMGLTDPHYHI